MATETMTVLFTDMVGSTAQRTRVGDAAADALLYEHNQIVRDVASRFAGRVVKDTGDGAMLVFDGASDAVHAGVAIQVAIEQRNIRGGESIGLRVGVSLGDLVSDGEGLHGIAAHEAARVCALADAGEVLVSDVVRIVAASRLETRLVEHGTHELKGIAAPLVVWSVLWERLADQRARGVLLPPRLDHSGDVFVGREGERSLLLDAFKQTQSSDHAGVVLVSGEPGIGKTSLIGEAARTAHEQDAVVLYGRCDEELAIPYQPWAEALRHLVDYAPAPWLGDVRPEIARLVPEVRVRVPDLPVPVSSDPDVERYVLFASVIELLAAVSRDTPVVLVLDDLHWADRPTTQLLRHLATSDVPMRVLVVGVFRDADIGPSHPLADTLAALHREDASSRISLRGLGDLELLDLMEQTAGHKLDPDGLVLRDELLAETDGNPFFAAEILRNLAEIGAIVLEGGRWVTTAELRTHGLPVSVREVVGRRVSRLGDTATAVLSAASVIGRDFDLNTLTELTDEDDNSVLDLLDRAVAANLVTEIGPGRFSFAHALVEHALYDELGATRRARFHRRVAEIIELQAHGRPGDRIGALAYHWGEAIEPQDSAKAIKFACQAGDHALDLLAPDEALRWYERSIELLGREANDVSTRCSLLVKLGDAQRQTGSPSYRETLLEAAHLAEQVGNTQLLVAAALANSRGFFSSSGTVDTERVEVLRRALVKETAEPDERALLLALLATELLWNGDFVERRAIADQAISAARQSGDPSTLLRVFNLVYTAIWTPDTLEERGALSREASDLARTLGDEAGEFFASAWSVIGRFERACGAEEILERLHQIAERLGQPTLRWLDRWVQSVEATRLGDIVYAEAAAEDALAIGTTAQQPDALLFYGTQISYVRWLQGRRAELVPLLTQVVEEMDGIPAFLPMLAACQLDAGLFDDARGLMKVALPHLPSSPPDFTIVPATVFWAEIASRLADVEAAELLTQRLLPYASLMSFAGLTLQGSVADALGRLATVLGHYQEADQYFDLAEDLNTNFEAPFFIALTKVNRAELQLQRDAPADKHNASQNLSTALEIARKHGFAGIERDAERLGQRFGW